MELRPRPPSRYASVRRFLVHLRDRRPVQARVVITTPPGEEGHVDYGDGGPMVRMMRSWRHGAPIVDRNGNTAMHGAA